MRLTLRHLEGRAFQDPFFYRCPEAATYANGADSNSKNAVNFSSARTMNLFPSSRCASATQVVRPFESIAET